MLMVDNIRITDFFFLSLGLPPSHGILGSGVFSYYFFFPYSLWDITNGDGYDTLAILRKLSVKQTYLDSPGITCGPLHTCLIPASQ